MRTIPIEVIKLAGGYKGSREGKSRIIATQEIVEMLPKMGIEIDYSAGKKTDPFEVTQPFEPLSVD